jgi:hypothetical protein
MGINSDLYNYHGVPGYYIDNSGSLQATFTITSVPEPSSCILISLGLTALATRKIKLKRY